MTEPTTPPRQRRPLPERIVDDLLDCNMREIRATCELLEDRDFQLASLIKSKLLSPRPDNSKTSGDKEPIENQDLFFGQAEHRAGSD